MAIILVVLILALFVLLIVHADKLVERLKLADGYDDDRIDFGNLTAVSVVMIAIIIVGGLQIVTSIPELIEMMFIYFSDRVGRNQIGDYSINISGYDFIYPLLRLIIGVLLLTNYSALAKILTKKIPSQ